MNQETFKFLNNTAGMDLLNNEVSIDPPFAEEITNLHATSLGSWSNAGIGYATVNASPLEGGAAIRSMAAFTDGLGIERLVLASADKLFQADVTTGGFTQLGSGYDNGAPWRFITFQGVMIGCNGVNAPIKWDGTNPLTTLGGWPPTIAGVTPGSPGLVETFANRVAFSGDPNNPSMVYLSALESPEDYTPSTGAESAGAIQVSPGDGQKITALKSLYLPADNEEILVVFKERSTFVVTGQDADTFALQRLSSEFGAVGPNGVITLGNQLLVLTESGITSLSTAALQGNLSIGGLSNLVRSQIQSLNPARLKDSFALHLRDRQEVWWFVPEGGETRNQRVLVMNYSQGSNLGYAWSRRSGIEAASGALMSGALYTGNYAGQLQRQLSGNNYDGQAIRWTYRSPYYALGNPRQRKRVRDLELYLKQIANQTLTLKMSWDLRRGSGQKETRTLTITPDTASVLYGSAEFGTDSFNVSGVSVFRIVPAGSGRYFQIELSGEAADNPIELQGWTITALYGGLR